MNTIGKIKYSLFTLLLLFSATAAVKAADYVDDINNQQHGAGQKVIYEMNVGMFTEEGTFAAAQDQLAELKRLGIDIVWLMPIYPRGGGINSPYAATNFQQVNPAYGTLADLKEFVSAAHDLNLEVMLDWVPNHMATNADWITTHPEYFKTDSSGNYIHPYNGAWGDVYQLDYSCEGLVSAMNECLKYWVSEADIDGYRCDYVSSPEISASYWQDIIPQLKEMKSSLIMLAETDMTDDSNSHTRTAPFDYDYAWDFQTDLTSYGSTGVYATPLKTYVNDLIEKSQENSVSRMVYITNHDQNWNESNQTLTQKYGQNRYLLTVLAHTVYGMPLVYNGQEVGGNQALNYFEDTKIDWTNVDKKMQNTLRTLNALKHSQTALHDGQTACDNADVEFLSTTNSNLNILAYRRQSGDSEVLVIINGATTSQTALLTGITGTYSLWLNSETITQGVSRKSYTFSGSLSVQVPAKGYLVYVKGEFSDEDNTGDDLLTDLSTDDDVDFFYETPVDNASITAWLWGSDDSGEIGGENYSAAGAWPGDYMTRLGSTDEGNVVYKLAIDVPTGLPAPQWLIVEENGTRIYDGVDFVNHGYYVKGQTEPTMVVPSGISPVFYSARESSSDKIYALDGRQVTESYKGIVVKNNVKVLQR